ncbi:uncharacterized protein [Prorops nasuta]|uniref:uncharacterized protein n=1 Tax=Prorops nasuta TaxID=863751 RepID=UPI0034CF584E
MNSSDVLKLKEIIVDKVFKVGNQFQRFSPIFSEENLKQNMIYLKQINNSLDLIDIICEQLYHCNNIDDVSPDSGLIREKQDISQQNPKNIIIRSDDAVNINIDYIQNLTVDNVEKPLKNIIQSESNNPEPEDKPRLGRRKIFRNAKTNAKEKMLQLIKKSKFYTSSGSKYVKRRTYKRKISNETIHEEISIISQGSSSNNESIERNIETAGEDDVALPPRGKLIMRTRFKNTMLALFSIECKKEND